MPSVPIRGIRGEISVFSGLLFLLRALRELRVFKNVLRVGVSSEIYFRNGGTTAMTSLDKVGPDSAGPFSNPEASSVNCSKTALAHAGSWHTAI